MKEISCNVIQDILPLYVDDVVSEETREMVEEHLRSCDSCREEADLLKKNIALPTDRDVKLLDARVLKNLKKRLLKSKVFIAAISVAMAAAVLFGTYCYLALTKLFIPYDSEKISIEEIDGKLYASYEGDAPELTVGAGPQDAVIDGEEKTVSVLCYYETLWSKYARPVFSNQEKTYKEKNTFYLGDAAEIDRIYYGPGDFRSRQDKEIKKWGSKDYDPLFSYGEIIQDGKVIWEK